MTKYIFCINSGRCGSHYLYKILNNCTNTLSFHEKQPFMHNHYLRLVEKYNYNYSYNDRMIKIHDILNTINPYKNKVYCETNHMFIKTFFDVVMNNLQNVGIIILRRYLPSILKSFIDMSYLCNNKASYGWMINPNAKTKAISPINNITQLNCIDRCIAYLIDIEARTQRFKNTYKHINIYETRIESLNNIQNIKNICNNFNLIYNDNTTIINKPSNKRIGEKYKTNKYIDIKKCEDRIFAYIEAAKKQGIHIPTTLSLNKIK